MRREHRKVEQRVRQHEEGDARRVRQEDGPRRDELTELGQDASDPSSSSSTNSTATTSFSPVSVLLFLPPVLRSCMWWDGMEMSFLMIINGIASTWTKLMRSDSQV